MSTTNIIFKPVAIEGFEHYTVSSTGQVVSHNWKNSNRSRELSPRNWHGYLGVFLTPNDGSKARLISVHRIVALTFLGPCPAGMEVDHINSIRSDNHIDNLQYLTHKENCQKKLSYK